MSTPFDERWLKTGACVPIDIETTAALVVEIHRLIDVVGGMALAQPEQEPVAHWSDCAVHSEPAYPKGECDCGYDAGVQWQKSQQALDKKADNARELGLNYEPQRTWVGLTESERRLINFQWQDGNGTAPEIIDLVEAKLKEKNA